MVILYKGMAIITGESGPSTDRDTLSQLYAKFALENPGKCGTKTSSTVFHPLS